VTAARRRPGTSICGRSPAIGWGTWIRTKTNRVRVCCATVTPFPNGIAEQIQYLTELSNCGRKRVWRKSRLRRGSVLPARPWAGKRCGARVCARGIERHGGRHAHGHADLSRPGAAKADAADERRAGALDQVGTVEPTRWRCDRSRRQSGCSEKSWLLRPGSLRPGSVPTGGSTRAA
jgi:hypothetical protein